MGGVGPIPKYIKTLDGAGLVQGTNCSILGGGGRPSLVFCQVAILPECILELSVIMRQP